MGVRTVRTLKIVVVHDNHLRIRIPADRASLNINLFHDRGVRVLAQVHLGHAHERLLVFRKQEIVVLLMTLVVESDRQSVVIWKVARMWSGNCNPHARRKFVRKTQVPLDFLIELIWRLGRAAETDQ